MSEYERKARRERLDELRRLGIDPYPARAGEWTGIGSVREQWQDASGSALEENPPSLAIVGRLTARRSFGKLLFLRVVEGGHSLQVSARKQEMDPEAFAFVKKLDLGDFVRFEGVLWRTKTDASGSLCGSSRNTVLLSRPCRGGWEFIVCKSTTKFRQYEKPGALWIHPVKTSKGPYRGGATCGHWSFKSRSMFTGNCQVSLAGPQVEKSFLKDSIWCRRRR